MRVGASTHKHTHASTHHCHVCHVACLFHHDCYKLQPLCCGTVYESILNEFQRYFFLTHLDAGRSSKHPHPQSTNHWTLRPIVEYSGDSLAAGRMSQDFRWYLQVVTPNLFVPKITAETKAQGNASANQAARFQSAPLRRQARLKISKII